MGKVVDQNFGPFLPTGPRWLNFIKILSLFNTQPNRPRESPASFKHVGQTPYSRGFQFGEKGEIKIWVHFGLQVRCVCISPKIFSTHNLIGLGPPLQVSSMYGRPPTQGAKIWGKGGDQNFGPFFTAGPWWLNFVKILSLFNTHPSRPRASPASFKHVEQTDYSRGFKFGEKGPIKILVHFCLQVYGG